MPVLRFTIEADQQGLSSFKQAAEKAGKVYNQAFKQAQGSSGGMASQTKEIKDQEEALKELRRELRRKISLVDADLRLGNKSQQEAEQSIQQIKEWAEAQGAFNREQLVGAQNLKTFANAQNRAKNDFRGMSAVTNRANQVLFDLNQGLQDIPFGMRGIGNNIPFVVEGFRRFGKAAREDGISPLTGFIRALASPAGLIGTAAAVIPTVITLFTHWDQFLSQWGISVEDAEEKTESFREEMQKLQADIDRFTPRFDVLSDLQDSLFPDQGQIQGLQQQLQLQREVEGTLLSELDDQDKKVQKLEKQVALWEGLSDKTITANEALSDRLITQQLAENILRGQVDIEARLIRRQNELNDAKLRQQSLEQSAQKAQKDQVNTMAEIESLQAAFNSSLFDGLVQQSLMRSVEFDRQATHQELLDLISQENSLLATQVNKTAELKQKEDALSTERRVTEVTAISEVQAETAIARAEGFEKERLKLVKERISTEAKLIQAGVEEAKAAKLSEQLFYARMEEAKTNVTKQEAEQRRNQALTAIGATGTALQVLFEEQKGIAIAGAIIEAGAAIVRQFKDLPIWAAIPSAALVAAKTAKQIEQMKSVEPGSGSPPGTGGGTRSNTPREGFRTTEINPLASSSTNFSQTGEQAPINITLKTEADDRIISQKAERGRKKRTQHKVTVKHG